MMPGFNRSSRKMSSDGENSMASMQNPEPAVRLVVAVYLVVHILLICFFDWSNPDAFLRGDRSQTRLIQIERVLAGADLSKKSEAVLSYGVPGDYLWQGALLWLGGWLGEKAYILVILFQVLLSAWSIYCVAQIAIFLGVGSRASFVGSIIYACLPNSTAFPHMLVSEAVFVPMCIAAAFSSLKALSGRGHRSGMIAGFLWGVAALTRPTALPIPLVVAVIVWWRHRQISHFLSVILPAFVVVGLWLTATMVQVGRPTLSNGDPAMYGRNLLGKIDFVLISLPPNDREAEGDWRAGLDSASVSTMSVLALYARHPYTSAKVLGIECAKMMLKSNETKVLNYLGLWEAPNNWGMMAQIEPSSMLNQPAWVLICMAVGTLLWSGVLLLAMVGLRGWPSLKDPATILLLSYAVITLMAALAVDFTQGRHRFPADFVFCILAGAAISSLWSARRASKVAPSSTGHA
jgi:hypothetical protein